MGLSQSKQIIGNITFGKPIPHSLRHAFAINTLNQIKARGNCPQQALPVLATYMGHRKYQYTAAYLKVKDAKDRALYLPHPEHLKFVDLAKPWFDGVHVIDYVAK